MFYVSSKKGDLYGVTDTKDEVEEFYSKEQLFKYCTEGIKIAGIFGTSINITSPQIITLLRTKSGTPCRIKLSKSLDFKQVIYLGVEDGSFNFYDGSGVMGYFILTSNYFINHKNEVEIVFGVNNPSEVSRLLKQLKG